MSPQHHQVRVASENKRILIFSDSVMGSSEITAEHLLKCVQQYERLASLRNQTTEAVVATGTRSDVSTTLPLVDSPYHIKYQWDAGTLKIISLSCKGPHGRGQSKLSGQVEAWISANKLDTIVAADVDVIRKMGDKGSAGDVAIAPLHKGEEPKSMGITFPRLIIELEVNNRGPSEMRETCASYFLDNAATPGSGAYVRAVLGIKVWVEERHACAILWMRPEGSEAAAPEVQQAWIFGVGPGISAAQQRAFEAPMEDSALPPVPRHLWQRSHVPASPFSPGSHNPRPIVRIPSATILYRVSTASRARISDIIDATKELEIDLGRVFDVCCA